MEKFEDVISALKDDLIKSIQELVSINSIEDTPKDGMPFGKGVDDALKFTLDLGKELGFKTFYGDGYYGYIEMGHGEDLIGILAHLDVVPVENPDNWTYPPFSGEVKDEKLYGRGSVDDKGPLLAALYAMKTVMENNVELNKRIRLILGTNEETHWKGINKYLELEEVPSCGFTPDSDYPLINAEKGLLQVKLSYTDTSTFTLNGGGALNSVPDSCTYEGSQIHQLVETASLLKYKYNSSTNFFKTIGKPAHSAKAYEGINAIGRMAIILHKKDITSSLISFMANEIGEDCHGENIFGAFEDDVSGKITVNMAKLSINKEKQDLYMDIRYPVTKSEDEVINLLKSKVSSYGLHLEITDSLPSLHVPIDHPLVKTLRQVFEDVTGLDSTPISTGGATYARALSNCVAFGPLFPGKPKLAHQDNEYVDLNDLMKSVLMYAMVIERLGK